MQRRGEPTCQQDGGAKGRSVSKAILGGKGNERLEQWTCKHWAASRELLTTPLLEFFSFAGKSAVRKL